MELQLKERTLRCLGHSAADTVNVEQTLELRLPENMPPIGRVLGAWGQPLLRGKDWQGEQALANGGVMVKALYESEDGLGIHCVEGWIPFTLRWELRDSRVDGHLVVSCRLRSVDARQVGAEKLMLRASVSAMAQALEEAGVDFALHIYRHGVHGLSTADVCTFCANNLPKISQDVPTWLPRMMEFFEDVGFHVTDLQNA